MKREVTLTTTQQAAFERLMAGFPAAYVLVLRGDAGMGKTTVLRKVHAATGGAFRGIGEFLSELVSRTPDAVEEAFLGMLDDALAGHSVVIVDDLHLVTTMVRSRGHGRTYLLDAALTAVLGEAAAQQKTLIFGSAEEVPWPIRLRAFTAEIAPEEMLVVRHD